MIIVYEWFLDAVIGFCALLILLNWAGLISQFYATVRHRTKSRFSFGVPFIWGLGGSGAMFLHPRAGVSQLYWLPLVLDPSIGLVLVVGAWQKGARWFQNAGKG